MIITSNCAIWTWIVLSWIVLSTNDFYKDIANDVECKFNTSNYEVNRLLPMGKNKKTIGLMKVDLVVR